jgi:hypothetical protein
VRPAARNLTVAAVSTCGGNGGVGGVSGGFGSISRAGRKRTGWRTFPASRRGRGRRLAAAAANGLLRSLRACTGKRNRERERTRERREEEEGVAWRPWAAPGGPSRRLEAAEVGGGVGEVQDASTHLLPGDSRRRQSVFCT